jgi:hypothetical protein
MEGVTEGTVRYSLYRSSAEQQFFDSQIFGKKFESSSTSVMSYFISEVSKGERPWFPSALLWVK